MGITRNGAVGVEHWQPEMTKIIDGKPVRFRDVCVHEIKMGDVDDPDLFVASPIYEWQQTDAGKFVMKHADDTPYWTRQLDRNTYGYVYRIIARLSEPNELFFNLKFR